MFAKKQGILTHQATAATEEGGKTISLPAANVLVCTKVFQTRVTFYLFIFGAFPLRTNSYTCLYL